MIIGVLKELKESEYRVSATPQAVQELVFHGHRVLVEKKAGSGSGFSDEMYINSGAEIKDSAEEAVKQEEPIMDELFPVGQN